MDLETKPVLKRAIAATRALAELKGAGNLIPNQSVLVRVIAFQEAKLSSEIESIFTTDDDLYRAFSQEGVGDPTVKEVLRYQEALWHGFSRLRECPLSAGLLVELAAIIKQTDAGIRRTPGTRIVDGRNQVIYTPPEGEAVIRSKLADLERFIHAEDGLDPLVKMAAIHYQFEAIHPFPDGNGRTGRILNILYLIECGLLELPVLYLSKFIIERKGDYYALLRGITEADGADTQEAWEAWTLFMLEAVERTATATRDRIVAIWDLLDEALEDVRSRLPRVYSKELVELIFAQPYCRIRTLEAAGLAERQTASKYLRDLEGIGWLSGAKVGREVVFVNRRFLELLSR